MQRSGRKCALPRCASRARLLPRHSVARVLVHMDDIIMDNPNSLKTLGHILATSVATDTLAPTDLLLQLEKAGDNFGSSAKLAALTMVAYVQDVVRMRYHSNFVHW